MERLNFVVNNDFIRLTYTEGIKIFGRSYPQRTKIQFPIDWGTDLQSEHERYLVEKHFKNQLFLLIIKRNKIVLHETERRRQNNTCNGCSFSKIGEIIGVLSVEERLR